MAKIEKKWIIAGAIGIVTIVGAVIYLQIRKIMQNTFSYKSVRVKSLSGGVFDFDVFFNYFNKSDVTFTLKKQTYDIFINNVYITTLSNVLDNVVKANTTSTIGVNVNLNMKEISKKISGLNLLSGGDKTLIKLDMKFKVRVGFITFTVPYVYEDTLKNMTSY